MSAGDADWTLRPAREGDAAALSELLTAAGVAAWGGFLGVERVRSATSGRVHPADVVAERAGTVVGFVAWDGETGEVKRLFVLPDAWGSGIGTALLDRAVAALRAAGLTQAWLNTEERSAAIDFYESRGWRREGEPRIRDWHGTPLEEPRFVLDL